MFVESSLAALSLATPSPEGAIPVKVLVFKPKTAKSASTIPLVVIAQQTTSTPSNTFAKPAGVKDPRLAKADLVVEFFGVKPDQFSIGNLNADLAGKIKIVVESDILNNTSADTTYVFTTVDAKLVLSAKQLSGFISSLGIETIAVDFSAPAAAATPAPAKSAVTTTSSSKNAKLDGAALIGITVDKHLDFPGWYQQILTKGEMLEYYDVSGCYIMRPGSYSIWEKIQTWFDFRIKKLGVQNAYFPMFVSERVLEREKEHIEGFAPEVAWVTRAGKTQLEEPIAIRPTSETVMYPYYAKWIRSHRDLPLKLNQWNSVVRWEFKHPQPFLRTREFLWQEGHTAHLTFEESNKEVLQILDLYAGIYEELLAVPVIKGKKTEKEKFAGGLFTTTVEGYIPTTGRGIQGATSHCLGQNFSKMFGISVENPEGADKPKCFIWQNSWGLSTRVIGVMVMIHSDNKGLVIPPRVAQQQAVVIPCGLTAKTSPEQRKNILDGAKDIEQKLSEVVRVTGDYRDNYSPGWKFSDWELKGVPLRIEFGPNDLKAGQITAVRRDNGVKVSIPIAEIETKVPELLETIQKSLYDAAKTKFNTHTVKITKWEDFVPALNAKNVILAPWDGTTETEEAIKEQSSRKADDEPEDERAPSMGAKTLCVPFDQPELPEGTLDIYSGKPATCWCLFGRSY